MSDPQAQPSPERILQVAHGGLAAAVLGVAAHHGIFDLLEGEGRTAEEVAHRAALAPRGTRALLDGCVALGLLTVADGVYRNTAEASTFLLRAAPRSLAPYLALRARSLAELPRLFEVARSGLPEESMGEVADNPFWEELVPAIAPLAEPAARAAAEALDLAAAGPCRWLDIGGGSGIYSAVWLPLNPAARAVQLDWANVNRLAREFVARAGVGDRFETIDGDFHTTPLGDADYDIVILSQIAHQESPESNRELFGRVRRALRPGGTFVVSEFVVEDDRSGPPHALLFATTMLLATRAGCSWRRADYREWLTGAGFETVEFVPTETAATLILAR